MEDYRDRLARAEQNIINHEKNFDKFRQDDFGNLKSEVHNMRTELNEKTDKILEKMSAIDIQMAKWIGAGSVLAVIGSATIRYFFG